MKPVLTPQEAGELDRATQDRGVSAADLMERAGRAVARAAVEVAGGGYGRRAVVLCGKGNNGGDGFVAARHLAREGMRVEVVGVDAAAAGSGAGRPGQAAGGCCHAGAGQPGSPVVRLFSCSWTAHRRRSSSRSSGSDITR